MYFAPSLVISDLLAVKTATSPHVSISCFRESCCCDCRSKKSMSKKQVIEDHLHTYSLSTCKHVADARTGLNHCLPRKIITFTSLSGFPQT